MISTEEKKEAHDYVEHILKVAARSGIDRATIEERRPISLSLRDVSWCIAEAKKRGLYSVPDMRSHSRGTWYQFDERKT